MDSEVSTKEEFITAIEEEKFNSFIQLLDNHNSKRSPVNLEEVLVELSTAQLDNVWQKLHEWTESHLTNLLANATLNSQQPPDDQVNNENLLMAILSLALIYLPTQKVEEPVIPHSLLELAVLFHGIVPVVEAKLQVAAVALCELWWNQQIDEREQLVENVFPILLESSLASSALKTDVHRVYAMRHCLQLFSLGESESQELMEMLSECASSKNYLCDEGVKFIALLFQLQCMVPVLHRAIKSMLPECTRAQSAKIAEIYFRAWKSSDGESKQKIEQDCLQDLMYCGVHVDPMKGRLSPNLMHLLHHIHRHKKHHAVATLIYQLYDPFIWRSLKVANGFVRMNATALLCDAFPLTDNTMNNIEKEDLINRQYQTLTDLLTDPCHLVRITAIKGICQILSDYWLVMPSPFIKKIFGKLLSELAADASCAEVRSQVIKGLTLLLDNPDAIPFLKEVLPRIGEALDDVNVNVRAAFVRLLIKVKATKDIRYWDVVPAEHLIIRLEQDSPAVCKLLVQLLLSSFHPMHESDQEILERSLTLIEENRGASRRFYRYASQSLDLPHTVHFMLVICRCLRNHVRGKSLHEETMNESSYTGSESEGEGTPGPSPKRKPAPGTPLPKGKGKGKKRVSLENKENTGMGSDSMGSFSEASGDSPLDKESVVGGLLDTMVILWTTNAHRLAKTDNFKYLDALRQRIAKCMPLFFKFYKSNKSISRTLLYLSSFLPRNLVPTLVGHCLSRLRNLQGEELDDHSKYINALCNWNRVDDILELVTEWLQEGFKAGTVSSSPKDRRSSGRKAGVRFETPTDQQPQPRIALKLLIFVLQHPLNKISALHKNRQDLLNLLDNMEPIMILIEERMKRDGPLSELCCDAFLSECLELYLRLVTVLHKVKDLPEKEAEEAHEESMEEETEDLSFDAALALASCLDWANRIGIPPRNNQEETIATKTPRKTKKLFSSESQSLVVVSPALRGPGTPKSTPKRKFTSSHDEPNQDISATVIRHLLATASNIIIVGAVDYEVVCKICNFASSLLTGDCLPEFWVPCLRVAEECYYYQHVYHNSGGIEIDTVSVSPLSIIKKVISRSAEYLREHDHLPKEADGLTDQLTALLSNLVQDTTAHNAMKGHVMQHIVNTTIDEICAYIAVYQKVDYEVEKANALPYGAGMLVSTWHSRAKLCLAFMDAFTNKLQQEMQEISSLLACVHVLQTLVHDSGKISKYSLKQATSAIDTFIDMIIIPIDNEINDEELRDPEEEPEPEDESSNEKTMIPYKDYADSVKEMFKELKSTLGVI